MVEQETKDNQLMAGAGRVVGHLIAVVVGLVLMIAGVAMGVTMVLLPFGIPIGLVGLFFFIWGLFGWSQARSG